MALTPNMPALNMMPMISHEVIFEENANVSSGEEFRYFRRAHGIVHKCGATALQHEEIKTWLMCEQCNCIAKTENDLKDFKPVTDTHH